MIELAVVLARLVQYIGAAVLFGSPLFCLYGLASGGITMIWPRRLVLTGGVAVVIGSVLALLAQTAMMAGSDGKTRSSRFPRAAPLCRSASWARSTTT